MDRRYRRSIASFALAGICFAWGGSRLDAQENVPNRGATVAPPATSTATRGTFVPRGRVLGTVTTEGGKIMFVSRVDKRTWTIMNPETLKGLEGQTVRIVGQIYRDTDSIHVIEVMTFRIAGSPASQ